MYKESVYVCVYAQENGSVTVLKVVPGGWSSMYPLSNLHSKADVEVVLIPETPGPLILEDTLKF